MTIFFYFIQNSVKKTPVIYVSCLFSRYVWNQLQEELSYTSLMVVTLISWLLEVHVISFTVCEYDNQSCFEAN